MTKNDIRSFPELARFAALRAERSLNRNDPWAAAYWKETQAWAASWLPAGVPKDRDGWLFVTGLFTREAAALVAKRDWTAAALQYSRAKWCVILARNLGHRMNPKETGVSPSLFMMKEAS